MIKNSNNIIQTLGFRLSEGSEKQIKSIIEFVNETTKKDYIGFIDFDTGITVLIKVIDDSKGFKVVNDNHFLETLVIKKHPDISSCAVSVSLHRDDLFQGYLTHKSIGRIARGLANSKKDTLVRGPILFPKDLEDKADKYINIE